MNKKTISIAIGSTAHISFPDLSIDNVPAKIDTGADSSSIWATNITMDNGVLSCNFFASRSVYYKNERFSTKVFKRTLVKNSFGQKEFRYKIKLKVKIGPKTILTWFTLANRSRNKYPILIGKNTLKRRFVVDVAERNSFSQSASTDKILVMCNKPRLFKNFFKEVSGYHQQATDYKCLSYDDLMYDIATGNPKAIDLTSMNDVAEYSFVYFKLHAKNPEFASALAEYLNYKSRPFIDAELAQYASASKITEYMKLTCYDLPIPRTICVKPDRLLARYEQIKNDLGLPFVLKEASSHKGKSNYLISNQKQYKKILTNCPSEHVYLAQEYIQNDGFYRAYVFGKEVGLAFRRSAQAQSDPLTAHLNKPADGTNAYLVPVEELPPEVQDLAVRAAACMNRQVAGVDILQDKSTHEWYILEVNNAPELRRGLFIEEKAKALAKYIDQELNR